MPNRPANVNSTGSEPTGGVEDNEKRLKKRGMSKARAKEIANAPGSPTRGGKKGDSGSTPSQGGTASD